MFPGCCLTNKWNDNYKGTFVKGAFDKARPTISTLLLSCGLRALPLTQSGKTSINRTKHHDKWRCSTQKFQLYSYLFGIISVLVSPEVNRSLQNPGAARRLLRYSLQGPVVTGGSSRPSNRHNFLKDWSLTRSSSDFRDHTGY